MGSGTVVVHYVNVDMLASGPPDIAFDDSSGVTSGSASAFDAALRFGSAGPKIYDYVLVSVPYSETAGSGLDDSQTMTGSVPVFYDDSWNPIWNASLNGTNATWLAGNYSHYSADLSDWQTIISGSACISGNPSATSPCHVNTTSNKIWIRLPHFSGTGLDIDGALVTSASSSSDDGGGGGTEAEWVMTYSPTKEQLQEGYTKEMPEKHRVKMIIGNETHYVGVVNITATDVIVEVSSTPVQIKLEAGEDAKVDLDEDNYYDVYVLLEDIVNNNAKLTIKLIHEEIPEGEGPVGTEGEIVGQESEEPEFTFAWWWIIVIIIVLAIIGGGAAAAKRRK